MRASPVDGACASRHRADSATKAWTAVLVRGHAVSHQVSELEILVSKHGVLGRRAELNRGDFYRSKRLSQIRLLMGLFAERPGSPVAATRRLVKAI